MATKGVKHECLYEETMSRVPNETRGRRPHRRFDDDFKAQAVRLVSVS